MKKIVKKIMPLFAILPIAFSSCNQDEVEVTEPIQNEGSFVYEMDFDCPNPLFDGTSTRATTNWADGSTVMLQFVSGSSKILGIAKYNKGKWVVETKTSLSNTSTSSAVSAVYADNTTVGSDYKMFPDAFSALYSGQGTYTKNNSGIGVNLKLDPSVSRLRFKGTSGQKITILVYGDYSYVAFVDGNTSLTPSYKGYDLQLTVGSDGYTPYIYGSMTSSSGPKTLIIRNEKEGVSYTRSNFDASSFAAGKSGVLTIPSSSNYQSLGWNKENESTLKIECNQLTYYATGAASDFVCSDDVYEFYAGFYKQSDIAGMTDGELINMVKNAAYCSNDELGNVVHHSKLEPNTPYSLVTVAYDRTGTNNVIYRKDFRTMSSTNQPEVSISNVMPTTYNSSPVWNWTMNMNSKAIGYFQVMYANSDLKLSYAAWLIDYFIINDLIDFYDKNTTWQVSREYSDDSFAVYARAFDSNIDFSGVINTGSYGLSGTRAVTEAADCMSVSKKDLSDVEIKFVKY